MPQGASCSGFTDVTVSKHNSVLILIFIMVFVDKSSDLSFTNDLQTTSPGVMLSEPMNLPIIRQAE